MKILPKSALQIATILVITSGLTLSTYAAANPKAGDNPNPKSSEPHPGDTRSAEGKAKAEARKEATPDKSAIDRYDTNRNGKLDPDEVAAMQADKEKGSGKKAKKDGK